ncbi:T9SS type A sorting domain-containing protein [bacterium]|nr:T9SS type A sorting domain-containing protein [bacterium]
MSKVYFFIVVLFLQNTLFAQEMQFLSPNDLATKNLPQNQIFSPQPDTIFYDDNTPSSLYTTANLYIAVRFTAPQSFTLNSIYRRILNPTSSLNTTNGVTFYVYSDNAGNPGTQIGGPFVVSPPLPSGLAWADVEVVPPVSIPANSDFHVIYGPAPGGAGYPNSGGWWTLFDGSTTTQRTKYATSLTVTNWTANAGGDAFIRVGGVFTGTFVDLQAECVANTSQKFFLSTGETTTFTAKISNIGNENCPSYTANWTVTPVGSTTPVFTTTGTFGPLSFGANQTITAPNAWNSTSGRFTVKVTVTATNETTPANNSYELEQQVGNITAPTLLRYETATAPSSTFNFQVGNGWGQAFNPPAFPVEVDSISYYFGTAGTVDLRIYSNNGVTGQPSTLLWSDTLATAAVGWNFYNVPNIVVTQPFTVFYMFEGVSLGISSLSPVAGANSCMPATAWQATNYGNIFNTDVTGDWMIRATVKPASNTLPPTIQSLTQLKNTDVSNQPYNVWARVTDAFGVKQDSVELFWKLAAGTIWNNVPMVPTQNDSFYAQIPATNSFNTTINYFVSATNINNNTAYLPYNPVTMNGTPYSFTVRLLPTGTLAGESFSPGFIPLSWNQPGQNGIELKYDDASSEFQSLLPNTPPGLNAPNPVVFANRFNVATQTQINGPAQLSSVKFFIANNALVSSTYKIKIFNSASGLPATVLYESQVFDQSGVSGEFVTIVLPNPVDVGSGEFFVGVEQLTNSQISLGGDTSLNPPYNFNNNTHFIQASGNWLAIETLSPAYGQIIPMIRCFAEPLGNVAVAPVWSVVNYKLYRKNGAATSSNEVVTSGSVVFSGTNQLYDDYNVVNPNTYSYAVTTVYDVNGTNLESEPSNFVVAVPGVGGTPEILVNPIDFGLVPPLQATSKNFTVYNVGTAALEISALTFSGSNIFSFWNPVTLPFVISAGDSAEIEMTCFPITTGVFNATLQIINNSSVSPYNVNIVCDASTDVSENQNFIPKEFHLEQNFPNPFNPTTTIKFGVAKKDFTKLVIFNTLGQKVKTLVSEELLPSFYALKWDGTDEKGKQVSSGIYFYRLQSGDFSETKKMLLLR